MTRPLLVFCAGTPWEGLAGSDRLLATALLRHADVLFVDPPLSVLRSGGQLTPRLTGIGEPMSHLVTVVPPFHTRAGVRQTVGPIVRRQIGWALSKLDRRPYAVVDCRLGGLLGGWGDGARNVLYATDDFVAGAQLMGLDVEHVRSLEAKSARLADLVACVSPLVEEHWAALGARAVFALPNGVNTAAYADLAGVAPASDVDLPGPIAGVVGHLSARIDMDLLEAVAAQGISLLLVGPVDPRWEPERFAALTERKNVSWLGRKPYEEMPAYLKVIDVGLTPYADTQFNRASFPLKTLEYLGAGRGVVSTDLPATRWLDTPFIRVASGPAEFAAAVADAVADPRPELFDARRAYAEGHSWPARADRLAQALSLPQV